MKKVIGFFGGDSQVGTTMIAQAVGECLVQRGRRVLLVCGSGKFGGEFLHLSGNHSLDDLKAGVISGRVNREDLLQTVEESKGMWVLPAVKNTLTAKYFPENTFQILLDPLEEQFEYIVVDGGHDANLGLTISALNLCRHRFFVITQQNKAIQRYLQLQKNVLAPLGLRGELIINKYQKDPSLFRRSEILTLCQAENSYCIPYVEYGWQAEMEGRTLSRFHKFEKAVARVVECFEPKEEKNLWKRKKNFV
ncbi:hypothetical protein ACDL92_03010 [Ihubacter sp. mB4P-1]|uniref:hypothetical protein n=1 Tax=Ihubacter sp. mB4P-1 TaxID=3242370 RepID=UPI003C7C67C2